MIVIIKFCWTDQPIRIAVWIRQAASLLQHFELECSQTYHHFGMACLNFVEEALKREGSWKWLSDTNATLATLLGRNSDRSTVYMQSRRGGSNLLIRLVVRLAIYLNSRHLELTGKPGFDSLIRSLLFNCSSNSFNCNLFVPFSDLPYIS